MGNGILWMGVVLIPHHLETIGISAKLNEVGWIQNKKFKWTFI